MEIDNMSLSDLKAALELIIDRVENRREVYFENKQERWEEAEKLNLLKQKGYLIDEKIQQILLSIE